MRVKYADFTKISIYNRGVAHEKVRNRINELFDLLSLIIVRAALLALELIGAYSLIRGHFWNGH